jgi:type VI secretion system protein ImpB
MSEHSAQQNLAKKPNAPALTFSVEVYGNGALVKRELVRSIGVLADLSAKSKKRMPLHQRTFWQIDHENFNEILQAIEPRLVFSVENTLEKHGKPLPVELVFPSLDDFGPIGIMEQIEPLRQRYTVRRSLAELRAKLDGNAMLYDTLSELLFTPGQMESVRGEIIKDLPPVQTENSAAERDLVTGEETTDA